MTSSLKINNNTNVTHEFTANKLYYIENIGSTTINISNEEITKDNLELTFNFSPGEKLPIDLRDRAAKTYNFFVRSSYSNGVIAILEAS